MAGLGAYRASRRIPCRRWWTRGRRRRRGPPCRCWRPESPSFSWSTPGTCPPWARAWPGSRARSFLAVFGSRKWLMRMITLGRCWFFWSEYSTRGGPPPTRRYRHASSFRAPSWAQSIDRGRGRSRLKAFIIHAHAIPSHSSPFGSRPSHSNSPKPPLTPPAGRTRDTAPPPCFPCRTARAGAPPPVECPAPAPARCCPSRQPARR